MQKITADHLSKLFTVKKFEDTGEERIIYRDEFIHGDAGTPERALYELVSDTMYKSDLSHDFSYEVASRAVDIIAEHYIEDECDHYSDFEEHIESSVPVYNYDLLKIVNCNQYHLLDEAREVHGNDIDTITACSIAWHNQIDLAVNQIVDAINYHNGLID